MSNGRGDTAPYLTSTPSNVRYMLVYRNTSPLVLWLEMCENTRKTHDRCGSYAENDAYSFTRVNELIDCSSTVVRGDENPSVRDIRNVYPTLSDAAIDGISRSSPCSTGHFETFVEVEHTPKSSFRSAQSFRTLLSGYNVNKEVRFVLLPEELILCCDKKL